MAKIATREAYGKALAELVSENENIVVLDADLSGSTKSGMAKKVAPDHHCNMGIAEGNMMACLLYTSPSPRDRQKSRMPSSA